MRLKQKYHIKISPFNLYLIRETNCIIWAHCPGALNDQCALHWIPGFLFTSNNIARINNYNKRAVVIQFWYIVIRDFSQDVAGVLHAERRGKGLHLFEKRRQWNAFVFRLAAHARTRRSDMQCHGHHGPCQRVVCQLELLLHRVQVAGREPVPGHHIVRQHRPGLGGHIRCEYDILLLLLLLLSL